MLNKFLNILCLLVFVTVVQGQTRNVKKRYVEIPLSLGPVFILNQPESPIRFDLIQLLTPETGKFPQIRYIVRNVSQKNVSSFTVQFLHLCEIRSWQKYGAGLAETTGTEKGTEIVLGVGGSYDNLPLDGIEIIPINETVSGLFENDKSLDRQPKSIWLGMITRVRFVDGTDFESHSNGDELIEILTKSD
ncbi:MAG: hypothetical protein IPJ30_04280 [Acidobacteria bacterium]|nr:hypothetical protein [Acidobacteriota bacterium]